MHRESLRWAWTRSLEEWREARKHSAQYRAAWVTGSTNCSSGQTHTTFPCFDRWSEKRSSFSGTDACWQNTTRGCRRWRWPEQGRKRQPRRCPSLTRPDVYWKTSIHPRTSISWSRTWLRRTLELSSVFRKLNNCDCGSKRDDRGKGRRRQNWKLTVRWPLLPCWLMVLRYPISS